MVHILRFPFSSADLEGVDGGLSDADVVGVSDLIDLEGVTGGLDDALADVLGVEGRVPLLLVSVIALIPSQLSQQL